MRKMLFGRGSSAVGLALALVTVGCGGGLRTAGSRAAIEGWTEREGEDGRPESRRIDGEGAPPPAAASRTLGAAASRGVVRRGSRIDVELSGAPLREAMRLLAEAAGMHLVIGADVEGTVEVTLRDVRPLDAIDAIARAHGVRFEVSGQTVIVHAAE